MQWREFVDAGELMNYGTSITEVYRRMGQVPEQTQALPFELILFDPVDRVDFGIARIAVAIDPFFDAAAAGIAGRKGHDALLDLSPSPQRSTGRLRL